MSEKGTAKDAEKGFPGPGSWLADEAGRTDPGSEAWSLMHWLMVTNKQRFMAMGEMLAAASPTEAARMLAGLPAPIKVVWRLLGRRRYQRFMAELRG